MPTRVVFTVAAANILCILLGISAFALRRKLAPRAREFLIVMGTVLLFFIVFEGGFRIYLYAFAPEKQPQYLAMGTVNLPQRFVRHHYLGYVNNPNYVSASGLNRHNSLGLRGEETVVPKPPGVYRIVFVGGSTTYSDLVEDYKNSWVYRTGKALRHVCESDGIETLNAGIGGHDSFQSLMNIQFRVLDLEPDLIVIHQGVNDAHTRFVRPEYYRGDNSGRRKPWSTAGSPWFMNLVSFRLALAAVMGPFEPTISYYYTSLHSAAGVRDPGYNELLGDTPMNVLSRNHPVYFERNLRNAVAVARANGVDILFVTWPYNTIHDDFLRTEHYQTAVGEINETTERVAEDMGVFFYRLHREMPRDVRYWIENRHVNDEGAEIKAELTAKGIAPHVCPRARREAGE